MTYRIDMSAASNTVLHNDFFGPSVGLLMLVLLCYVAGRVHQFFRHTVEREQAYREGYNTATKSLFSLATRTAKQHVISAPPLLSDSAVTDVKAVQMQPGIAPVRQPRHRARGKSTMQENPRPTAWDLHKSA